MSSTSEQEVSSGYGGHPIDDSIEDVFALADPNDAPEVSHQESTDSELAEPVSTLMQADTLQTAPQITAFAIPVDAAGHCKINRFEDVPAAPTVRNFPFSRIYKVQSVKAGITIRTSGYALSRTRVLTSDVHVGRTNILVARLVRDGSGTSSSFAYSNYTQTWSASERVRNAGQRYCILKLLSPIAVTDGFDESVSTIGHAQAFGANPNLTLITHRPPGGNMIRAQDGSAVQRITSGTLSNLYTTFLPGFAKNGSDDYMLGSPIFFSVFSAPIPPGGPPRVKTYLVGVVTVGVVRGEDCTVQAGLFTETTAITRLLQDIPN